MGAFYEGDPMSERSKRGALDRGAGPGPGEVSVLALYLVLMLFPAVRRRLAESPARACSVRASRR